MRQGLALGYLEQAPDSSLVAGARRCCLVQTQGLGYLPPRAMARGNHLAPHSWTDASSSFDFKDVDAVLIPGAALDDRNVFSAISFIGALVGLAESKTQLAEFFELLGGEILDSIVIQATISFKDGNSGLVMELHRNGVFLGRTPANQTESLAESARIYSLTDAWVKINWLASGKFKAEFSFFGHA